MSTELKNKLLPRLRFPEFKDAGEWEKDTLINIASFRRGSFPQPYGLPEWYDNENGLPFIQVFDVDENFKLKLNTKNRISELAAKQSVFIPKGTLIITIQGSIGRVAITQYDAYIDRTLLLFEKFYREIDLTFFAYTIFLLFEIEKQKAPGGIIKTITKEVLSNFIVPIPSLPEQKKIASCLSSLDELIEAESQKLELYQQHKKGLLQNLFPQEGEKVPKLRFPEFKNAGEWEVKKLGEVYHFLFTNSFSRENLNYENGFVKNIHYGDIHTKFSTLFDITKERVPFVNPDISIDKIREESYCKEGDIVFADASEDLNDVGKSIEIINLNGEKLLAGLHTLLARQIKKEIVIGFGGYLFKSDWIRKQIQRESQGAKVLGISASRISNVKISYPKNPEEQQKIASCLSSLDEIITAQTQKIALLQQHKKGLLQNLFPQAISNFELRIKN